MKAQRRMKAQMLVRAQAAEEAAREAYAVEADQEDASRRADGMVAESTRAVTKLQATMKLRLRWVLACEARAGRTEAADWQEEFAVPEGPGATKMRATCKRARDAFDVSRRYLEEVTSALGRIQHVATSLASDWHTAMEWAREASVQGQVMWMRLLGTEAEDMVEYFRDASKALEADMARVARRFAMERQLAKEAQKGGSGVLLGIGFWTDPRFGGCSSDSSNDSNSGSDSGGAAPQSCTATGVGGGSDSGRGKGPARQRRDAKRAAERAAAGGGAVAEQLAEAESEAEQLEAEQLAVAEQLEKAEQLAVAGQLEEAEQLAAVEAVAMAVALEAVADWEAEAEREEALATREAAAREEAIATPDGRAADGQSKVFDPGGCVALAAVGGEAVAVRPQRRLEEPQVEEEEEEVEVVPNGQPIGLHSSAVCGGESE